MAIWGGGSQKNAIKSALSFYSKSLFHMGKKKAKHLYCKLGFFISRPVISGADFFSWENGVCCRKCIYSSKGFSIHHPHVFNACRRCSTWSILAGCAAIVSPLTGRRLKNSQNPRRNSPAQCLNNCSRFSSFQNLSKETEIRQKLASLQSVFFSWKESCMIHFSRKISSLEFAVHWI